MLVLTRKVGETIMIGDNIRVTVTAVEGGKVRLGVDAPRDVTVDRQEVHEQRNKVLPPAVHLAAAGVPPAEDAHVRN